MSRIWHYDIIYPTWNIQIYKYAQYYTKLASARAPGFSCTHCFFRLYLCFVTFGQNGLKLNSRLVYCSRLYGMHLAEIIIFFTMSRHHQTYQNYQGAPKRSQILIFKLIFQCCKSVESFWFSFHWKSLD